AARGSERGSSGHDWRPQCTGRNHQYRFQKTDPRQMGRLRRVRHRDYSHQETRAALNVPIAEIAAARFSVYTSKHDPFVKNVGPLGNLSGWESQDDIGGGPQPLPPPLGSPSCVFPGAPPPSEANCPTRLELL